MKCVPPIIRLHQEFCTFTNNAITDLNESIRRLEKARMEYRAALLWMKNVSEKLHDPDQRNQLVRFREVCTIIHTHTHTHTHTYVSCDGIYKICITMDHQVSCGPN